MMALLAGWSPAVTVSDGEKDARLAKLDRFALLKASPVTTVTAIGTCCTFSARFSAVTTISWSCELSSANAKSGCAQLAAATIAQDRGLRITDVIGRLPKCRPVFVMDVGYTGQAT